MRSALAIGFSVVLFMIVASPGLAQANEFDGTWTLISGEADGKVLTATQFEGTKLVLNDDRYSIRLPNVGLVTGKQTLDPTHEPKQIDIHDENGPHGGKVCLGIYEFEGKDQFRVVFAAPGQPRPTGFQAELGSGQWMHVWHRAK